MLDKLQQVKLRLGDLLFSKYQDSQIKIKDHFKIVGGKTPATKNPEYYQNGTIKWLNSGILTNLYFLTQDTPASKLITAQAVQENNLLAAEKNSVLISRINPGTDKVCWVQENVFCNQYPVYFSCDVRNLKSNNDCFNAVLFFALRQSNFLNYSNGCFFAAINSHNLANLAINWVSNPQKQKIFLQILNNHGK